MVLIETGKKKTRQEEKINDGLEDKTVKKLVGVSLRPPCAKCAAVGADVVEGGLSRVALLFPLPLVDDELPLEVGQELEVLLLLGHAHHLDTKKK